MPGGGRIMDLSELMWKRKSIRNFRNEDVPDDLILELIDAARSAPSAGNCQPWHFYVIRNENVKKQLYESAYRQSFLLSAPVLLVVCAVLSRTSGRYGDRGVNLYCIQDTAAAVQNLLLRATSLGLGTCWVGAFDENAARNALNLDKDKRPVAIIPVGYPATDPAKTSRRPVGEIATFIR